MKIKYLTTVICSIALITTKLSAQDQLAVTGYMDGFGNDRVVVFCVSISDPTIQSFDTIISRNGSFDFEKKISEPTECAIFNDGSYIKRANGKKYLPETNLIKLVLLPNQTIEIRGTIGTYSVEYETTGNALNESLCKRRTAEMQINEALLHEELRIDSLAFKGTNKAELTKLDSLLTIKRNAEIQKTIAFIKENPNEELSAYYLTKLTQKDYMTALPYLSPTVRNGLFKKRLDLLENNYKALETIQKNQKTVQIGRMAPDFTLKSNEGKMVQLSSFKGKYVVLSFWGSWCHWCMSGVPKMVQYHNQYKNKVTFIGINVRDTDEAFKNTIQKYAMNWIQLKNLTETDVPSLYGVSGYPTKFILDPNQKIVARIVGEDPAFYTLLENMFSK